MTERENRPVYSPWAALVSVLFLCSIGYGAHATLRLRRTAEELAAARSRPANPLDAAEIARALPSVPGLEELRPSGRPLRIERAVLEAERSGESARLVERLRAIEVTEGDAWARVELGALAVRQGLYGLGRDLLLGALEDPATREKAAFHLFLASEGLALAGPSEEALDLLALERVPGRWTLLARAIRERRDPAADPAAVTAAFDAAVRTRPSGADGAWAHLYRSEWRDRRGDAEGARFDLEAARAVDPAAALPAPRIPEGGR